MSVFDDDGLLTPEETALFEKVFSLNLWIDDEGVIRHAGDWVPHRPYIWMDYATIEENAVPGL